MRYSFTQWCRSSQLLGEFFAFVDALAPAGLQLNASEKFSWNIGLMYGHGFIWTLFVF